MGAWHVQYQGGNFDLGAAMLFLHCAAATQQKAPLILPLLLLSNMPLNFYNCCNFAHFWPFYAETVLQILQIWHLHRLSVLPAGNLGWSHLSHLVSSTRKPTSPPVQYAHTNAAILPIYDHFLLELLQILQIWHLHRPSALSGLESFESSGRLES